MTATVYNNQSPQNSSTTIANGSTSGTTTITTVGSNAFPVYQGENTTFSSISNNASALGRLTLTNTNTLTANRNTSNASNSVVINGVTIDPTSSMVQSVQIGTITISSSTSNTATITSVDTTRSAVFYLGQSTTVNNNIDVSQAAVTLTDATTVTAKIGVSGTVTVSYVVVQFATGIVNSIQQFANAYTTANTQDNQTITGVVMANSMIAYGGQIFGSNVFADMFMGLQLSSTTNVQINRTGTGVTTRTPHYTVIEFVAGVLNSVQRGSIALTGATSNTATITSVSLADAFCNYLGFSTNATTPDTAQSRITQTNATTLTANKNTSTNNSTVYYEEVEFSNVTGIAFDAATNSTYQAASSSYSWSHTCTGGNRYLVVGVAMLSLAQSVSSITYNSVALEFIGFKASVTGACRVELWGLVAPATGSNTIAVTLSGSIASAACAASYTGVHQSSPYEAFNSAQATNVGAADATVNVTTVADNDWCVDIVATDDTAITVGTGNTSRNNVTGAGGSGAMGDNNAAKTPAGSVTMSWTNVGALATWAIGAVALRPTAAATLSTAAFNHYYSRFIGRIGGEGGSV